MRRGLSWKFAFQQLGTLKHLSLPFILSSGSMFSLEYILISLMNNEYVNKRHEMLPMLIKIAIILVTALTMIFVLYANNFYHKQRRKEFGLYTVLGLEKRHIRGILAKEKVLQFVCLALFSTIGGHLLGKFIFMGLNKLMNDTGATLMDYPFKWNSVLITLGLVAVTLCLCHFLNSWSIYRLSPVELLHTQHVGEKEPRSKKLLGLVGLLLVGSGYYIALTHADNVLSALQMILVAILLVMVGTYGIFMSVTIMILKGLKRHRSFYYRPVHFLSISGMLSRMKSNAISLASISILCTGILLTLGLTLSVYRGIEDQINHSNAYDYTFVQNEEAQEGNKDTLNHVLTQVKDYAKVQDATITQEYLKFVYVQGEKLEKLPNINEVDSSSINERQIYALRALSLSDFNDYYHQNFHLEKGKVLMTATTKEKADLKELTIMDKSFKVQPITEDFLNTGLAVDHFLIVFPDSVPLDQFNDFYNLKVEVNHKPTIEGPKYSLSFNVKGSSEELDKHKEELEKEYHLSISSRKEKAKLIYELDGGLLFLGLVVGLILVIGVGLMLYYKQISEGQEDHEKFVIMGQIGLPDSLIKQTIRRQILTIFLLPILFALANIAIASKILQALLRLVAVRDIMLVQFSFLAVTIGFVVLYGVFYGLTSHTYHQLVHPGKHKDSIIKSI